MPRGDQFSFYRRWVLEELLRFELRRAWCNVSETHVRVEGDGKPAAKALEAHTSKSGGGGRLFGSFKFWSLSSSNRGIVQPSSGFNRDSGAYRRNLDTRSIASVGVLGLNTLVQGCGLT